MSHLSLLAIALLVLGCEANHLDLKGPPCPDGNGLYAVGCSQKYLECVNNVEYVQTCPEGLTFDRLMSRCERRSNNYLCNSENRRTLNVRQKVIAFNCTGRLSGDYPLDKTVCNENYYQCSNGMFFMRKCPHQQVYVPLLKRCDYKSMCNDVKTHPARAYASPTYDADNFVVTTKEFENGHHGIDCKVQGDMYFTNDKQCSPYFFQCSNGKLFRKTCPEGLIYVLDQNLCDYPQGVKGCPEYDGSETSYQSPDSTTTSAPYAPPVAAPAAPYAPIPYSPANEPTHPPATRPIPTRPTYNPPKTTYTPRYTSAAAPTVAPTAAPYVPAPAPVAPVYSQQISYNPAIHGDCKNKDDGFYGIKHCHSKFLACTGGYGRVVFCAENLYFDERVSACDFADACNGPRKQEDISVLYNHGGAYNEQPAEIKVDFDCTGKSNGDYVKEACSKTYFRCQDGRAFAASCAADLVYNKATLTCDYADHCDKNYVEPSKTYGGNDKPIPTIKYEAPVVYTTQPPKTTGYTQPARDTERPSTIYARPIYTKAPTTVGYEEPVTTRAPYTTHATEAPIIVDDFSCTNLIDGNHASGLCKNVFYTCSNNQLTATRCPGGLVFNPYLGQCDYEENVRDCKGYQPVETTTQLYSRPESTTGRYAEYSTRVSTINRYEPIVTDGYVPTTTPGYAPTVTTGYGYPTVPVTPGYAPVRTTKPPRHAAYCELLSNGNYGRVCEQYFIQCYNSETFEQECPAGLYYSIANDRCDHKENVEGCPEYKPTPTTTPAAEQPQPPKYGYKPDKYPNIDYTTTTPGPVDTTPIAEAFSCYGRPDGIYALPYCSKDYVQCIHGRSLVSSCAAGLFYSESTGLCDYKANVEICGNRKGSDIISTNACSGKADGYYSVGCSSHYFSCINERIRKETCPNKLKFSKEKKSCQYPTDISECSISVNPDRAPPAVPSDFCVIRPNGLHAFKTCSPHYVVCDNKRAIAGTCATPLVFNGLNQLCDYKSNNKECVKDYIPAVTSSYNSYTTPAQEQPTTTATPYVPQTTTTGHIFYKASSTTTQRYQQPTTTTTPYQAPTTTTTQRYQQPTTTTTQRYQQPTTTTTQRYEQPTTTTAATTTPSRDVEIPTTTTGYKPYEETTTTPARDVTTTTASYVPTTTAHQSWY
ncbi:hypothetical protein GCK72_024869 [Caenorhabditis remanei]|uniref:Chitin-binding type-2 domain-containing protein n=1 Tax=Caenorhabditis remanei TaxID=31234 RepID=A0A6A5G162_CAERE|nr:hypothetical protein GCK72_024869 [Caenorhabditis remanei]KAF1748402.1 hypothetical protein GCK72_024869 [Caenorhabditis remanei]